MRFIENVEKERFNRFVVNHPKGHFLQSSEWGEFKSLHEWKMYRVGLEENGELVAAALLLVRNLPVIKKPIIYSPRGYVMDFKNQQLLETFTRHIRAFAEKLGAIFVKIDPDIKYVERDIEGNRVEGGENNEWLIEAMKKAGYIHKGFELDFNGIQPRFCFRLDLTPPEDEIFQNFHPKTRYNIRLAERRGIEIIEGTREDLPRFTEIMKVTGERDGFITRPLSYFQEMYDTLVPAGLMKLFLARYNVQKAYQLAEDELKHLDAEIERLQGRDPEKAKKQIDEKLQKRQEIEKRLLELQDLKAKHPDGIIISGAIAMIFGDKAWYLYGASDNIFRNLMPNYLIQWEMIRWAKANGCKIYDFRGISGDLSPDNPLYGLYRFKKGFNGEFTEFVGEFDLVLNKPLYYAWEVLLPKFKKARRKLKMLMKRNG